MLVYDLSHFDFSHVKSVYLVNETRLTPAEKVSKRFSCSTDVMCYDLNEELCCRDAVFAVWHRNEFPQLVCFLESWQESGGSASLADYFLLQRRLVPPQMSNQFCALLYESANCMGCVVRMPLGTVSSAVELPSSVDMDCWRYMFPDDFSCAAKSESFAVFFGSLFPQLKTKLQTLSAVGVVKYCRQANAAAADAGPPQKMPAATYQTVGTLLSPASDIFSRYELFFNFEYFVLITFGSLISDLILSRRTASMTL